MLIEIFFAAWYRSSLRLTLDSRARDAVRTFAEAAGVKVAAEYRNTAALPEDWYLRGAHDVSALPGLRLRIGRLTRVAVAHIRAGREARMGIR
jgi:hypothetical protein